MPNEAKIDEKKKKDEDYLFEKNIAKITAHEIGGNSFNKSNNNEYKTIGFALRKNYGKINI